MKQILILAIVALTALYNIAPAGAYSCQYVVVNGRVYTVCN